MKVRALPFFEEQKIISKLCNLSELEKRTFALILLSDIKIDFIELEEALKSLEKHGSRIFDKIQEIYEAYDEAKIEEAKKFAEIVDMLSEHIRLRAKKR